MSLNHPKVQKSNPSTKVEQAHGLLLDHHLCVPIPGHPDVLQYMKYRIHVACCNNVWQRSKVRGSQPRPVWAIQGLTNRSPWEPTKAFGRVIREAGLTSFMWNLCCKFVKVCNFLSQGVNLRHSGPFRTKLLYLALGAEIFCIFTLGVEAAFDWCLVVCTYWTCWISKDILPVS